MKEKNEGLMKPEYGTWSCWSLFETLKFSTKKVDDVFKFPHWRDNEAYISSVSPSSGQRCFDIGSKNVYMGPQQWGFYYLIHYEYMNISLSRM